jgi:hypothetical protein
VSSKIVKFIRNIVEFIRNQVFPIPGKSAESYTRRYEDKDFFAAFESLEEIARGIGIEQSDYLLSHAQKYLSEEDDRGGSIMSRAQALLVAQTFIGALSAFGTLTFGDSAIFENWGVFVFPILITYTLILAVLLTINALRAISGLAYRRIGTSDLVQWLPKTRHVLVRNMALLTLSNYRHANILNTWRSNHLGYAQTCIRNIVLALTLLVAFVFLQNWISAPKGGPHNSSRAATVTGDSGNFTSATKSKESITTSEPTPVKQP